MSLMVRSKIICANALSAFDEQELEAIVHRAAQRLGSAEMVVNAITDLGIKCPGFLSAAGTPTELKNEIPYCQMTRNGRKP
ncbi:MULTISPECIES: hypothetical protein [Aeromonas]|uniref:Uncharacterized protein n=1 Tax=Aeromonas caviae TaxID=648 RepID=A0AAJ5ZBF4_AERCA|nr:hypothetical protein [Aeromonas caviae]WFG00241.1 hypothetical protein P5S46_22360 [Aeromonas caviae]WVM47831.1 hypothetical protein V0242_24840 [Aeromonas hydrophila]